MANLNDLLASVYETIEAVTCNLRWYPDRKTWEVKCEEIAPILQQAKDLADEVSILDAERQRLVEENAKLKKENESLVKSSEAAWEEVTIFAAENKKLNEINKNQYLTLRSIENSKSKMYYSHHEVKFDDFEEEPHTTDYALKA